MGLIAVRVSRETERAIKARGSISQVVRDALDQYLGSKQIQGKSVPAPPAKTQSIDLELAEWILRGVRRIKPNLKPPNMNTWAEDCRKMREIDGRTPREIAEVFKWANNDHFWQANILSPGKLRKQFDQLEIKSKQVPSNAQKSPRIDHDDTSWIYGGAGGEACERPVQGAAGDQAWLEGSVLESGGD